METQQASVSQSESVQNIEEAGRKPSSSRFQEVSPDIFLSGAAASIAISLFLRIAGRQHDAQFVGQWAPTLLLLGLYSRGRRRGKHLSRSLESREEGVGEGIH
jgi:hypothetical protein